LWSCLASTHHFCDGLIYRWSNGNSSGSPFTSELNSIYNNIAFYYVYLNIVGNLDQIATKSCFLAFGDDNIWTVDLDLHHLFVPSKVKELYLTLGLTYTDFGKDGDAEWHHLNEVEFLKRSFRFIKGSVVAPLSQKAIFNMVCYQTSGIDSFANLGDRISTALYEASLHGKEFYDSFYAKLRPYLTQYSSRPAFPSSSWHRSFTTVRGWNSEGGVLSFEKEAFL
jgi:hypothetical protein